MQDLFNDELEISASIALNERTSAVEELLESPERRGRLGLAGRRRVERAFLRRCG